MKYLVYQVPRKSIREDKPGGVTSVETARALNDVCPSVCSQNNTQKVSAIFSLSPKGIGHSALGLCSGEWKAGKGEDYHSFPQTASLRAHTDGIACVLDVRAGDYFI